ncbi:hypothetical protein K1T71_004312 [Dendrolimus kikuchii]|uniref:Uncharacterized protein n=1 Tax=Dendrolimus kikuchii TaxID=765133 RepID=A0ACC1D7C6_9NEOP|nr:hypothetical protein K1T71_004312 [Dendrolimus kikuchii]
MNEKWQNDEEIQRFREYLRIPSVHPKVDYGDCVKFLKKQAVSLDLPVVVYELVPKKPIVVITWKGLQPNLPAIMLNSHMDVVPVYEDSWTYPPFEARISDDGFIYARGTQDMKCVGMFHLEAVRRLKNAGIRLRRTVHITFVPDEEINSVDGMRIFSESQEFKKLNVGFELDESMSNPCPGEIIVFYGERTSRQIKVTCRGEPGHGSILMADTAGEKFHYIVNRFMTLRAEELKKLKNKSLVQSGEVITVNLTQVEGGVQVNVLPEKLTAYFDIRIPPFVDHDEFENMISKWCQEAGEGVTFEYIEKNPEVKSTKLDDSLPFWGALEKTCNEMGYKLNCLICPGATDARFIRRQGIPAINFSPLPNTPMLIHCHDERLHVDVFKTGIDIMKKVLVAVANV